MAKVTEGKPEGVELKRLTVPVRCDNGLCRNLADYEVVREDTPLNRRLHLCKHCVSAIAKVAKKYN